VRKSQIFSVIELLSPKYTINKMCEFYNVSRRSFYDFRNRQKCENPDQPLIDLISECYERHKHRFGYRRVKMWLKREKGLVVNKKKVLRIASRNNLLSAIRRRKIVKCKPNGSLKYENILNRKTHSDMPNTDWVTDYSDI